MGVGLYRDLRDMAPHIFHIVSNSLTKINAIVQYFTHIFTITRSHLP